jgi:hypothetical protein
MEGVQAQRNWPVPWQGLLACDEDRHLGYSDDNRLHQTSKSRPNLPFRLLKTMSFFFSVKAFALLSDHVSQCQTTAE